MLEMEHSFPNHHHLVLTESCLIDIGQTTLIPGGVKHVQPCTGNLEIQRETVQNLEPITCTTGTNQAPRVQDGDWFNSMKLLKHRHQTGF